MYVKPDEEEKKWERGRGVWFGETAMAIFVLGAPLINVSATLQVSTI